MANNTMVSPQQKHLFREDVPPPDPSPISHAAKQVFFFPSEAESLWDEARGRASETDSRTARVTRSLRKTSTLRQLAKPDPLWPVALDALAREMPNFVPVIETIVRPHIHLVNAGVMHRMAPVLLLGEPGVGKTHFVRRLARILGVDRPLYVQVAAETNGAALAGSSSFWSNAQPGLLFEALAWGTGIGSPVANPLVLLDELDKVRDGQTYDPVGALYTLLESDTAGDFQDQALPDLRIDTSSVRWIATANDPSAIPAPLRSRMCVFDIAMPSPAQLRSITLNIYRGLLAKYHLPLADHLPASVLDRVASLPPREVKLAMDCAIASAVARSSFEIQPEDLTAIADTRKEAPRRRIGFR